MRHLIIIISFLLNFSVCAEIKISEVKKALKEDDVGNLKILNDVHPRNAKHAIELTPLGVMLTPMLKWGAVSDSVNRWGS